MIAYYSVTLNFFLPENIVKALKDVNLPYDLIFDWRVPGLLHCTVKAIASHINYPSDHDLSEWIEKTNIVLTKGAAFKVSIRGVSKFAGFPYAILESEELITLHNKLFEVLPSSQPHFEGSNFIPHASLGIVENDLVNFENLQLNVGSFDVNEIQFVVWDTGRLWDPRIIHRFSIK